MSQLKFVFQILVYGVGHGIFHPVNRTILVKTRQVCCDRSNTCWPTIVCSALGSRRLNPGTSKYQPSYRTVLFYLLGTFLGYGVVHPGCSFIFAQKQKWLRCAELLQGLSKNSRQKYLHPSTTAACVPSHALSCDSRRVPRQG